MTRVHSYLPGHGDTRFSVQHYDLDLDYKVTTNHLSGEAVLRLVAEEPLDEVVLDLWGLRVSRVSVDGRRPARFGQRDAKLRVRLAQRVPSGATVTMRVTYAGKPSPVRGLHGNAGWEELTDGVLVGSQPDGAPSWFPCNDRIDNKATYRLSVTVPSAYHVVGNGTLTQQVMHRGKTTYRYEQRQPTSSYLACIQIGRYRVTDLAATGATPPVQVVHPPSVHLNRPNAFARQAEMVSVFSTLFGPYPFDVYRAVIADDELEIPLEAQSLSCFGRNHVEPTWENERLVAHELAHQWFGNSLTAAHWSQVWLHEGFACYAEWIWSEWSGRRPASAHAKDQHARLARLPQDLVLANPGPKLMFDDRVYKRGALTLHRIRQVMGDDTFFAMLRSWSQRHAHELVTTAMFRQQVSEYTEGDKRIQELLTDWVDRRPLPALG